jgi:hypothetical protein
MNRFTNSYHWHHFRHSRDIYLFACPTRWVVRWDWDAWSVLAQSYCVCLWAFTDILVRFSSEQGAFIHGNTSLCSPAALCVSMALVLAEQNARLARVILTPLSR